MRTRLVDVRRDDARGGEWRGVFVIREDVHFTVGARVVFAGSDYVVESVEAPITPTAVERVVLRLPKP